MVTSFVAAASGSTSGFGVYPRMNGKGMASSIGKLVFSKESLSIILVVISPPAVFPVSFSMMRPRIVRSGPGIEQLGQRDRYQPLGPETVDYRGDRRDRLGVVVHEDY